MEIRKSAYAELPRIMEIYAHAREFMAAHGNPRQWGATNWPPKELIMQDIRDGNSYVCVSGDRIVGTFFYRSGEDTEPSYANIEDGKWIGDSRYGVIHRIASDGSVRGVGTFAINWCYGLCGHLRIDTHPDNHVMQSLLHKLGFVKCGVIYVEEDDDPRYAYEKTRPAGSS